MHNENNEIEKILDTEDAQQTTSAADSVTKKVKKRRSAGAKRRLQYRAGFTATIVIAVALVILLNVIVGIIADRFPITLDISKDKTFTLSEQSIEIAKQVEDDMELVIFAEQDIFENPSTGIDELDTTLREFNNALKQYNAFSGGKVTYTFIDPNQEPQKFAAYSDYDVEAGDMLFRSGDRYKTCTIYDGSYGNDLYTIDTSYYSSTGSYAFESKAEKLLASNVYALSGGEEHIVQVLVGHSEDEYIVDGLKSLYELNGYTFEELNITGSVDFNKTAEVMLIAAPQTDYSAEEIQRVRDWVYNDGNYGHHLLVYVHPTADCPNLYEFLEVEYQITVTDEIILETDYNRIQNYNYLYTMADVADTDYTLNSTGEANVFTPVTRRLTTTLPAKANEGAIQTYGVPILQYPDTAKLSKLEDLNNTDATEDAMYAASESEYPLNGMIVCAIDEYNNETDTAVEGRVMVSGCSSMAYGNYIKNANLQNEELLLDTLNTMTGIENAITISSKTIENETVVYSSSTQLIVGLGIFTIGLPVIVLIICLVVFLRRKNL